MPRFENSCPGQEVELENLHGLFQTYDCMINHGLLSKLQLGLNIQYSKPYVMTDKLYCLDLHNILSQNAKMPHYRLAWCTVQTQLCDHDSFQVRLVPSSLFIIIIHLYYIIHSTLSNFNYC